MTRSGNRRGSVLVMALWIIAVLSVIVMSFAFEARQQAGIDIYVRERNRSREVAALAYFAADPMSRYSAGTTPPEEAVD